MKATIRIIAIACGLVMATAAYAAPPAGAPADSTGLCKDGTYYTGATKKGACKGHKGVKEWWGGKEAKAAEETKAGKTAATKEKKKAEETAAEAAAPAAAAAPARAAKPAATAAAGGGPGKVWVNTESKVYHCEGDRWYGKTKQGEYMTEAEASAKGYRASGGKACK